jgi:hypothetical protein
MFKKETLPIKIILVILSLILSLTLIVLFFKWSLITHEGFIFLWTFLLSWTLIGVCFMYFQTFKYTRLHASWYRRRDFESERLYTLLLVPVARRVITKSFIRHLNPRIYLKDRNREKIRLIHEETRQSETSHLISGLLTLIIQVFYLSSGNVLAFCILAVWNILFNAFPVLVQRMNRFEIENRFSALL